MKVKKEDIAGIIGTLLFHLAILLLLGFTILKTAVPEEDEGIFVNFGNVNESAGLFEPRYTGETLPQNVTPPPQVKAPEEPVMTQDVEETVNIAAADKEKEEARKREEERKRKEDERRRLEEEQRKKEESISNRVAGAFGIGSTDEPGQGDADAGTGNQGNPFGNTDQGPSEGVGGFGSFELKGRVLRGGGLPRPKYTAQEEGRIVVTITVDPKGNVIGAEVGKGTNIDDASMRRSALEAARSAKFSSVSTLNNQTGTITYNYRFL